MFLVQTEGRELSVVVFARALSARLIDELEDAEDACEDAGPPPPAEAEAGLLRERERREHSERRCFDAEKRLLRRCEGCLRQPQARLLRASKERTLRKL